MDGGDTGYIRHRTGKNLFLSRESIGLPYLGVADSISEEAWVGDKISGNEYRTIKYFHFTTVILAYDD